MIKYFFLLLIFNSAFAGSIDVLTVDINETGLSNCFPMPSGKEIQFGDPVESGIKFYLHPKGFSLNIQGRWEAGTFKSAETELLASEENESLLHKALSIKRVTPTEVKKTELCHLRQGEETLLKISFERRAYVEGFANFLIVEVKDGSGVRSLNAPPHKVIYEGDLEIKKPLREQPLYSVVHHDCPVCKIWVFPGQKIHYEVLAKPGMKINEFVQTGGMSFTELSKLSGLWKDVFVLLMNSVGGESGLKEKLKENSVSSINTYNYPSGSDELRFSITCGDTTALSVCHMAIQPSIEMIETKRTKFTEVPVN